jgi:nitrogen-specific signal transduction histidine kinase
MSKTIIEKHSDGILDVQNTKNGAMFIIKLPINNT